MWLHYSRKEQTKNFFQFADEVTQGH